VRSKPTFYIAHMLGHEGKGSLLSALKRKGLSEGLSAGLGVRHPNEATFDVSIKLTPAGVERIDEVVGYVFEYIELMRRNGVEEWMYEEQRKLADMRFLYAQKADPRSLVRALAANLHELPARDVLRGNYALDAFEPALIEEYIAALRPDTVLVTLVASGVATDAVTPKYGIEYRIDPIAPATVAAWREAKPHAELALPGPNQFVPDNLALYENADADGKPAAIVRADGFELWHRLDTEFGLPLANFYFSVRSPVANDSPRHALLTTFYVRMVNDQLQEFAYDADIAGLGYQLYQHIRGFTGKISGYNDKQRVLLERMVSALRAPDLSAERFAIIKEDVVRGLRNEAKNSPYRRALAEVRHLLIEPDWSDEQLLAVADDLDIEDLRAFVPELLARVDVVSLAHGNVDRKQALAMGRVLGEALVEPASAVEVARGRVVKLNEGDRYVRDVDNTQDDSAVVLYFQGSDQDYASRARAALITQIMGPPFFEALRTEKKLGYIVFATHMSMLETPGIAFVVQSPIAGPAELTGHVESFLGAYDDTVMGMDESTFARHKAALLVNLLEADAQLGERSNRYWNELDQEEYDFDLRERIAAAVRATTLADLKREYASLLGADERRRLLVRAAGLRHKVAGSGDDGVADGTVILNAPSFKLDKGFVSG
ncbi:MAG: insulinase family protein, partial [Gammaproteobacteria bacterium]|nr:insulinase family protein [Gammaproteobacteria bacterium]